ncbi:uncharacterized protein LOC127865803 [Dreissena polymorpha]|uniref:uncharacterized protein LOC127865803 n=1 Tax=Dreissena polymorpha TaxID=45954 RepID=UPI002263DF12|nr:uncharacterized protein LOC127865803 [Dreissena polymorpha]
MQVIHPEENRIKLVDEFRSEGECTSTTASLSFTKVPGVFLFKDSVGGLNSGDYVIVAIEESCFQVVWACVKRHVESGKCKDYWVAAKTRQRIPDAATWKKIDKVLQHIGVQSYEPVNQSQPCSALKKTY